MDFKRICNVQLNIKEMAGKSVRSITEVSTDIKLNYSFFAMLRGQLKYIRVSVV